MIPLMSVVLITLTTTLAIPFVVATAMSVWSQAFEFWKSASVSGAKTVGGARW